MNRWELLHGDCRAVMANMGDNSVDSVVCDPPYHLTSIVKRFGPDGAAPAQYGTDGAYARASRGFMGQTWDGGDLAFNSALWAEVWRVLKPGGHLLAFSGSRTYHRMACAIEDAGFEIRDMVEWIYGSGFPKSLDISKALDKAAGAERETAPGRHAATGTAVAIAGGDGRCVTCGRHRGSQPANCQCPKTTAPATDAAREWEGWGTALKPAHEPICLARKPLSEKSIAANVLKWGTGALNIDGCRIGTESTMVTRPHVGGKMGGNGIYGSSEGRQDTGSENGRWPANLCHDGSDEVVAGFPAEAGAAAPVRGTEPSDVTDTVYGDRARVPGAFHSDSGSAARFFYCAKASKADRGDWCSTCGAVALRPADACGCVDATRAGHPTVKPESLMRWLCRMVTPPGGLIFDPFTGSGSTGKAAMLEGFRFIGAELTAEYLPIARARIAAAAAIDAVVIAK